MLPAAVVFPERGDARGKHQPNWSPHRVYVTQLRWYAQLFAAVSGGDLYEVKPHAPKVDVDAYGSFWCPYARVVAVAARGPVEMPEEAGPVAVLAGFVKAAYRGV